MGWIHPVRLAGLVDRWRASFPQYEANGNGLNFADSVVSDAIKESTETLCIASSATTADRLPSVLGAVIGLNVKMRHWVILDIG